MAEKKEWSGKEKNEQEDGKIMEVGAKEDDVGMEENKNRKRERLGGIAIKLWG